jgi:hypothetical protein
MNDTSDAISKIVLERYRSMTPAERWLVASSLFESARAIIQSSLPSSLTTEQLRLAIVQRLYKGELPEEALVAHAKYITANGTLRIRPEHRQCQSLDPNYRGVVCESLSLIAAMIRLFGAALMARIRRERSECVERGPSTA